MSVTPQDFLDLAIESSELADSEINYRNIISRSYYAIYSLGIDVSKCMGLPQFSDIGSHVALQEAFKTSLNRELKLLATRLRVAHTNRIVADYRLDTEITREFSTQVLTTNKKIFADLKNIQLQ